MKFALSRSLWHGRSSSGSASSAISIRRPTAAARSYSGGMATPRASASARYASTIRSGTNSPGMAGPSWIRRSESATRRSVSGRWTASSDTGVADDEPRDEIALRPDERGHLRTDADPGRRDRRGMLHLPADAEQVGVVAGQPDDPALVRAGRVDPEVPVGDPARQRRSGSARARRSPGPSAWPATRSSYSGPRRIGVVGHADDRRSPRRRGVGLDLDVAAADGRAT